MWAITVQATHLKISSVISSAFFLIYCDWKGGGGKSMFHVNSRAYFCHAEISSSM
jgi:hypothetical protein